MEILNYLQPGWNLRLDSQRLVIYEAMLPYTRAPFKSTFEVVEFGHPKRLKQLVTIHSYEPIPKTVMV